MNYKPKNGGYAYPLLSKMKDRIFQIMKQEGLNQKEFAATTGISPATLSSIFNGRTSPTLNHAEALHRRFPKLNMSWLMFGEGDMYVKEPGENANQGSGDGSASGDLFQSSGSADGYVEGGNGTSTGLPFDGNGATPRVPVIREVVKVIDKPKRRITSITIFFDDDSFETFYSRQQPSPTGQK